MNDLLFFVTSRTVDTLTTDYDEVAPNASAMIESLRAHGYTLSAAIADIIDNSIGARCSSVWLVMEWADGDPSIAIVDDGCGMSESELINAMRLGSKNPLEQRDSHDLGRFGLGLKTASFSQSRRLTVVSKKADSDASALRRWDLDYLANPKVKGWNLLKSAHPETRSYVDEISTRGLSSGTVVLLEKLDRVVSHDEGQSKEIAESHWVSEVARVREHLAMVFHRFLSGSTKKGIRIFLNDSAIDPWDPFYSNGDATQPMADDTDSSLGSPVKVKGFVLPHRDKFDLKDRSKSKLLHSRSAGPKGWNAHQGFYLYRNRRLIVAGDWLGLGPGPNGWMKEEHYKLARIRVDISNSMDQEWQIDVKKSTAIAPPALRSWLSGYAKSVRERARDVYAFRGGRQTGKRNPASNQLRPWRTISRPDGAFSYAIDRRHPLFKALVRTISTQQRTELETLLRVVEETVPVQRIWIDAAENQDGVSDPFETEAHDKLREILITCHEALVANGLSEEKAWEELAMFPAFQTQNAQAIIGQLRE